MIRFQCHCGTRLKATDDKAGGHAKCPGCGVVLRIPDAESTPTSNWPIPEADIDPPSPASSQSNHVPYGTSRSGPMLPTMVVVGRENAGPKASGLGLASLIIGILCLTIGWMPLLGCVEIPIAFIGFILGFVGAMATSDGRTRLGFPIAGILVCLVAIIMPFATTILMGVLSSAASQ